MFDWITNAASNAGAWISDGFGNFIDWILSGLSVLFSPIIEIGEAFLDLFNAIWDFAAGLLGSLGDLFDAFFPFVPPAVSSAVTFGLLAVFILGIIDKVRK